VSNNSDNDDDDDDDDDDTNSFKAHSVNIKSRIWKLKWQ